MPFARRFKILDNALIKAQLDGLLGLWKNEFCPRPVGPNAALVFILGNQPFQFFIRHGVKLAQIGAPLRPEAMASVSLGSILGPQKT
jgi:hypothetical protein